MSWKKTAAVFMTALCISGGASAYDLQSIAKAHLPPAFTYQDIPEQQELKFHNFTYPYHMGQLSVMLQKSRKFAYGYIVTAKLPPAGADTLKLGKERGGRIRRRRENHPVRFRAVSQTYSR